MAKSALRNLVFPENPFALGSSPDRIAPVHILNGFVAACKGYTDLGDIIPALVAAQKPPIEKFPSLLGSQILSKNVRVQRLFQDDLKVIVGPDRRIWPTFGSPIPIVASLAGNDASDSRFGPILWEMLSRGRTERDELEDELEQLLSPSENEISDPITALAEVLSTGATPKGRRGVGISPKAWFAEEGTKSGHVLADSLTEFLENLLRTDNSGGRLLRLRAFGRGLYLVTILSLILGPITAASSADVESVEDIGLLFVWGGTPPGTAQDAVIVSAARSLQTILDKSRRALVESLYNALQDHPVPSQLPASQRRRSVLERQLRLAGLNAAQATKHLDTLRTKAGIEVDGDTIPDLE